MLSLPIDVFPCEDGHAQEPSLLKTVLETIVREMPATNVELSAFRKHHRGPKKPQTKRKSAKNKPHVSTAIILLQRTQ